MTNNKEIIEWMRLQHGHPTLAKLVKLFNYADELGIHLDFSKGPPLITDYDTPKHPLMWMQYVETDNEVKSMPPDFDFKVVHKSPEFLEEQQRIRNEYAIILQAKKDKEYQDRLDNEKTEAYFTLEGLERRELARLKKKYERQK